MPDAEKERRKKEAALFAPPTTDELDALYAAPTAEELATVKAGPASVPEVREFMKGGQPSAKDLARVVGGFGYGALEASQPTELLRGTEFLARAALTPGGFKERMATAAKDTIAPSLSEIGAGVRTALTTPPWKLFGRKGLENFEKALSTQQVGEEAAFEPISRTAGGLAAMVAGMVKGARGGPARAAGRAEKAFEKTARRLLQVDEDVVKAIRKNPDEVVQLVQTMPKEEVSNVALKIADELAARHDRLSEPVKRFRGIVAEDRARKIGTGPLREALNKTEAALRTEPEVVVEAPRQGMYDIGVSAAGKPVVKGGGSVLSASDESKMGEIARLLAPEKISPRDAMLIVDKIDALAPPDPAVIDKGLIGAKAYYALRGLRTDLKQALRGVSKDLDGWLEADKAYAQFQEHGGDLIGKFSGDQRESFARTIFNQAKDPIRQRLVKALSMGEGKPADAFFDELNRVRAAQGIKTIQMERTRPAQERVHEIVRRWREAGGAVGSTAGTGLGAALGFGGGAPGAIGGASVGGMAGMAVGKLVGQKIGIALSDPMRVLAKAQKAKTLSDKAQRLAKDVSIIGKAYGTPGMQAFFNTVGGASPVVRELQQYILVQETHE